MDFLNPYTVADIPLLELLRNLSIGLVMAVIWAYVIGKSTRIIVDTRQYLPIFLMLIPGMILIITIIKSSIALSLGLVGALSIVRFRTPIKEPEELLYIFIAIAIGLGLGANQVFPTVVSFVIIIFAMLPYTLDKKKRMKSNSAFADLILFKDDKDFINLELIKDILDKENIIYKTKRVYENNERLEILIEMSDFNSKLFDNITSKLKAMEVKHELSFSDNSRVIT